ncbi:MAG: hypothetical protein R3247_15470 [Rhodothermales bacterium]|nr:hypothetical protein [Rhodothermales bacterium]
MATSQNPEKHDDAPAGAENPTEGINGAAGTPPPDEASQEAADAYTRARRELNASIDRLRYEMAQFDADKARARARTWVEENPMLAVFLAIGAGILAGKVISAAFRPPPPPTLGERLRSGGHRLAARTRHYAQDVGSAAAVTGERLARRAGAVSETVAEHARELGEVVAHRAEELAAEAAEQAGVLGEVVADRSARAAHSFKVHAAETGTAAREKAEHGFDLAESAFNAAKTVLAAVVVKRAADWIRRIA